MAGVKIYTKTGDEGKTGLYGGARVSKSSPRIRAYGEVDELNAVLGLARAESTHEPIKRALGEVQAQLFVLGAQLASPTESGKIEVMTAKHVEYLERQIDVMTEALKPLKTFILPGGTKTAALLHVARTICRRAERTTVALLDAGDKIDKWVLIYLNRLSDYLFTLARTANQLEKVEDIPWVSGKPSA